MEEKFNIEYQSLFSIFLFDSLIFLDENEMDEELRKITKLKTIKSLFNYYVDYILEVKIYPEEIKNKLLKIADYIDYPEMKEKINKLNDFSYQFYYKELTSKYNDLSFYNDGNAIIWSKKDISESLKYDFRVLFLYLEDNKLENDLLFILDQKFLASLRKIYMIDKDLFYNSLFTNRYIKILKMNIDFLNNIDDNIIKLYIKHNYMNQENYVINLNEMEKMKKDCLKLMDMICNDKRIFNYGDFLSHYKMLLLEEYLFNNGKINEQILDLEFIYSYIDGISDNFLTNNSKKLLIDLMDTAKKNSYNLEEYNYYLVRLNSLEVSKHTNYKERVLRTNHLLIDENELKESIKSIKNDLHTFKIFMLDNDTYEKNKEKLFNNMNAYSINFFIKLNPDLFLDDLANSRAKEIIKNSNIKGKNKTLKKLKQIEKL